MTEVGHADLSRLLQSKRIDCNAIVTRRKRKLRELFAVASQSQGVPEDAFTKPDAQAATAAEWQFLQANDVLRGKHLNEHNIPSRPKISLNILKDSLAKAINATTTVGIDKDNANADTASKHTPSDATIVNNVAPIPDSQGSSSHSTPSSQVPVVSTKPPSPIESTQSRLGPESVAAQEQLKRMSQVTFPPGTKGSPSGQNTTVANGTNDNASQRTEGKLLPTQSPTSDTLSIKLPAESARLHDAVSSPGSTAPSATTPAVHDASADTSPENDIHHDIDANGGTLKGEEDRDLAKADGEEAQELGVSAENQILQESIRSNTAATSLRKEDNTPPTKDHSDDISRPTETNASKPGVQLTQADQKTMPTRPEVPDSQGNSPEGMDVDNSETQPVPQSQPVLSTGKPNPPTQNAPTTPLLTKPTHEPSKMPERAVTRVSSGAMRLKSVTEIVGGTPRSGIASDRNSFSKDDQLTPVTSTPQSPASRSRPGSSKKDKSKGQFPAVLFGKQPKKIDDRAMAPGQKETIQPSDDYYTPLFVQNFTGATNWMQPIEKVLFHANKTIATPDAHLAIHDHQACKVLRRVYHLQQHDKWSLRQPKRCPEPTRPTSQWDVLLQEMKWMRTDFREERKWKMSVARTLAYACADWHRATLEERKLLEVPAVIPPKPLPTQDVSMADADEEGAESQMTPDLVSSGDADSPQPADELTDDFVDTVAPSAIFTLQEDDVVFRLRRTPASDQLLEELPLYGSPLKVPRQDLAGSEIDPDAHWKRPALPLSKYVEGHMKLQSEGPPRKRSRFNYESEESDDDERDSAFPNNIHAHQVKLPPTTDEVALFNPETKHIRDRLHAGHQFRPPSEHVMPIQSFYECRSPSQWTVVEDDELRGLVREYSYNWSLISNMLSTRSLFTSGAERRTPWECFERWINLEGLPSDMQKTQYFKAYNSRIEAAQRVIAQQNQLAAQQASAGGAVTPIRRRQSTPLRVERRRNQKHLTLLDAMRKLAKKRETTIHKQQQAAAQNNNNSTVKKGNEAPSQRPTKTPRDYSLLRWERDQALAEKMAQYAQRQEAQRRAAMQARAQSHNAQMAAAAATAAARTGQNGTQATANNAANGTNGASAGNDANNANRPNIPNQLAAAAAAAARQTQGRLPMQNQGNAMAAGGMAPQMNGAMAAGMQMKGASQAQMQAMQGQHRLPVPNQQPDANLMLRAQRISEQQRAAVQMQAQQQQQQQGGTASTGQAVQQHSPPNNVRNGVGVANQQAFLNNAQAMMAQFNAANANGHAASTLNSGHVANIANGTPTTRMPPQLPAGIMAQLNQLEAQFKAKNPNLTPEQARQVATEHLTRAMMAQRQSAMNAAAGGTGQPGLANSIAATTSPHQYAALLRQQQQQQAQQQQQQQQQHHHQAQQQQQHHHQQQQKGQQHKLPQTQAQIQHAVQAQKQQAQAQAPKQQKQAQPQPPKQPAPPQTQVKPPQPPQLHQQQQQQQQQAKTPSAGSPGQVSQRQSSGSATPSSGSK